MKGKDQKAGVVILISYKIDFKIKAIKKDKERNYLIIKGSIQEEDITVIKIHVPNIEAPKYIQQTLTDIKGEIDGNTIILGDLTLHSEQIIIGDLMLHSHQRTEPLERKSIKQQRP